MDEDESTQGGAVRFILPSRQKIAGNRHLNALMRDEDEHERGYMARMLILATLPHSNPGDVPVWGRRNGDLSLTLQPGMILTKEGTPKSLGYPYGSIPRLLLAWMTTEAKLTGSRTLTLGPSLRVFMQKIGLTGGETGGKTGNIARLHSQMDRLFTARIIARWDGPTLKDTINFQLADRAILFWDHKRPEQGSLWDSSIILSEPFYKEISEHAAPVDLAVLRDLTRSPMALDIYMWLTYRMHSLKRPTTIPWAALEMQFGADYNRTIDFRRRFLKALEKVLLAYPANVAKTDSGLLLAPSRTHIPRRT